MRYIPDFSIYFVILVSTVLIAMAGLMNNYKIWYLYFGITFGLLVGFLQWQNHIWKGQQIAKKPDIQSQQPETKIMNNSSHPTPPPKRKSPSPKTNQTAYSQLSNDQLKKEVLNLVDKMRGFLDRTHMRSQTKSDYYSQQMRQAKTEAERQIIWNAQTHELITDTPLNFEYSEKFKAEATLLHDELLKRLPSEPKDNRSHSDYEHPTNPIGLNMVIDDLDRLAKSLPK